MPDTDTNSATNPAPATPESTRSPVEGLWRLDSPACSLWLLGDANGNMPKIVWFGPEPLLATQASEGHPNPVDSALQTDELTQLLAELGTRPQPPAALDSAPVLSIFPEASSGSMASPALAGHRNGLAFNPQFKLLSVDQTATSLCFHLSDKRAALELTIVIELDPESGVVGFESSIRNTAADTYQLDWLAAVTLPINDQNAELLSFHGRWGLELQSTRRSLEAGRIQIENLTGRTGHLHFPGVVAGTEGFDHNKGLLIGTHLAWSGSHRTIAEALMDGANYVQSGALLLPGEVSLAQGESYQTPKLYAVAANGLNQMSQRFHSFARRHILPKWTRTTRPIHANSWEAVYFDHQTETLQTLVDAAAANGAERFVLDDGWFIGRRDDTAGLGDWFVDKSVYPDGLHPLVQRVRDHGMQFGLWFEPEMVNPNSNLYREHPEWALHVKDYQTPLARHQLVLNIALPEVQEYLFNCIASLVDEYHVDYIKWDMNRDLVIPGNGAKAAAAAQPTACYALMDRLIQRFPELQIETCSSGGARTDMAVLQRTGRVWTSDNIDPLDRANIQRGFLYFLPPEVMGAHVGSDIAHLTSRQSSLHTRAIVALQGQYGFELDTRKIADHDKHTLRHYTNLYKTHRDWLAESRHWKIETGNAVGASHNPSRNPLLMSGQVSEDAKNALWFVIMQHSNSTMAPGKLVPCGLEPALNYQVKLASTNHEELRRHSLALPLWIENASGVVASGNLLMKLGLQLPVLNPGQALLISCEAVASST